MSVVLTGGMHARLIVSLSGMQQDNLDVCRRFADEMDRREVPLSLLVAPRREPATDWVRGRIERGDALVLHGFDHGTGTSGLGRLRNAEFAALPAYEAGLRLKAARAMFEAEGLRTDTFVPPRWLASRGTHTALRANGFRVCAELTEVHDVAADVTHTGRVLGFGRGERSEPWWCRAVVLGAARAVRRDVLVRIAVDADDLFRDGPWGAALDAIDLALEQGVSACTYGDLAADVRLPVQREADRRARVRLRAHVLDDAPWPQTA